MAEVILSAANFKAEIEEFQGVALVDCWANWCGPCRLQGPIIEKLAKELEGRAGVKIAKLDADSAPELIQRFNIRSIPTLIFFKNGQPAATLIGVTQAQTLKSKITELAA